MFKILLQAFVLALTFGPLRQARAEQRSPFLGREFCVRETQASLWLKANPSHDSADLVRKIANHAQAYWINDPSSLPGAIEYYEKCRDEKRSGTFVIYAMPGRDNGNYSAGGLDGPEAYEAFIRQIAKEIGGELTAIVLEPDAIGLAPHLTDKAKQDERFQMLAVATAILVEMKCLVYIDVSQWLSPDAAANGLARAGIQKATGFCLNTSGYDATKISIAFGEKVSKRVGDKRFIIDTSRNGNGAWTPTDPNEKDLWCNPPGRALGVPPTAVTDHPLVDAFLWIKPPGESDGACRGGPSAGAFWLERAIELARNAQW